MKKGLLGAFSGRGEKPKRLSQEQLADIAGISPRTLRDIEKGIANPELETLLKICHVLEMEIKIEVIK